MPDHLLFLLHKDTYFCPHRMASLGVCTRAAPPAGWLLSWQQWVPPTARWTSPWGWSAVSRDASLRGKKPRRQKWQEQTTPAPKARVPELGRYRTTAMAGYRVTPPPRPPSSVSHQFVLRYLPECAQRGSCPTAPPLRQFKGIHCRSEFPKAGLQGALPGRPPPFSHRCGPYQTPQTRALLSMVIFSTGVWVTGIFLFRQTLKLLLSYHGWMFEMHGKTSHFTKIWAVSRSRGGFSHLV